MVTFWISQSVLVTMATVLFLGLVGRIQSEADLLKTLASGGVCSLMILLAQFMIVRAPDASGGRREISPLAALLSQLTLTLAFALLSAAVLLVPRMMLASALSRWSAMQKLTIADGVCLTMLLLIWFVVVHQKVRSETREQGYYFCTKLLLAGSMAGAIVCVLLACFYGAIVGSTKAAVEVLVVSLPGVCVAGTIALGSVLYLKGLWIRRAPWYETHCAECGYDLSGNLGANKCPECGTGWRSGTAQDGA
jgi:hypothetical protein